MEDMSSDSDIFSQVDDVKDIQLKHFSSISSCESEHIYFVRKKNFFGPLYAVHVYPDGTSSDNQGYVSVKVSKVLKDRDAIPDVAYDNITWTFCVVDVNECGRYYQSVAKESVVNLPYQIVMPKFLSRSFVLERADELLPGDVLTIRCEASFVFYSVHALDEDLVFDVNPYHESERMAGYSKCDESSEIDYGIFAEEECVTSENDDVKLFDDFVKGLKCNESSERDNSELTKDFRKDINHSKPSESDNVDLTKNFRGHINNSTSSESDNTGLTKDFKANIKSSESELVTLHALFDSDEDITYYILIMLGFLHEYHECKERRSLDSKDFVFQTRLLSKILLNTDETDEIGRTYMWTNTYFKIYIRLKSKVKDILSKNPMSTREEENLENEKYNYHPIYTRGSHMLFSESYSVMKKISEVTRRLTNSSIERGNKHVLCNDEYEYLLKIVSETSEGNPMWKYLYEAMLSDESDLLDSDDEGQAMTDSGCGEDTEWNLQIETKDNVIFNIPFEEGKETFGTKLIASSSVFESMLRNPMMERLGKKVRLSDIDFRTFRSFLQFLQGSGVVTDSFIDLCNLYEMADKYNVEDLMFDCGLMFKPFLSEETVSMVEALACMHSDDSLLEMIESFKNGHSGNFTQKDCGDFVVKRSTNPSLKEKRCAFDFYQ